MKKFSLITTVIALALATTGAFYSYANVDEGNSKATVEKPLTALAYYRAIPNDPSSCTPFTTVDCSPNLITPFCKWDVPGKGMVQLYDAGCQPLHYDPQQ